MRKKGGFGSKKLGSIISSLQFWAWLTPPNIFGPWWYMRIFEILRLFEIVRLFEILRTNQILWPSYQHFQLPKHISLTTKPL